jgi:hypothetical protein
VNMKPRERRLLVAVVIAAMLGFAAGWFMRVWTQPTVEDRMRDAAHQIQESFRRLGR